MQEVYWITDEKGNILVDFIGKFENLETDFTSICDRLNRKCKLPHIKSSQRGDYRDYYDDETIEIVSSFFKKDIEKFGYKF